MAESENEERTVEYSMVPVTEVPVKLEKWKNPGDLKIGNFPDVSIALNENFIGEEGDPSYKFENLEITVSVHDDDPRLKAIDIYTQFAGICTICIKHTPIVTTTIARLYSFFPRWNDTADRVQDIGETVPTTFVNPVNYLSAMSPRAHSKIHEENESGGTARVEIGMARGNDDSYTGSGGSGSSKDVTISVPIGNKVEDGDGGTSNDLNFALECHNPLYEVTFVFKDTHPIPFSTYMVWCYFNDDFEGKLPIGQPICLDYQIYSPDHLRVAKIISREAVDPGYMYGVKYLSSVNPFAMSTMDNLGPFILKYEIGRWVLLSKKEGGGWVILPTSSHYWEDIVDYIRRGFLSQEE